MAEPPLSKETPSRLRPNVGLPLRDRWLARFAMSFVVVGVVLAWQGFRALQLAATDWRGCVEVFAAATSFSLGVVGFRARYRHRVDETGNITK